MYVEYYDIDENKSEIEMRECTEEYFDMEDPLESKIWE